MAKIRILCSDPYATECSSDDDESIGFGANKVNKCTNGNLFVHEISSSTLTSGTSTVENNRMEEKGLLPQRDHSDTSGSSGEDGPVCINQENDGAGTDSSGDLKRATLPGLRVRYRLRPSGRWSAEITKPGMKRKSIYLGTYDTREEAAEAYDKKKIELEAESSNSHGGKNCVVEEEIPARGASTEVVDSQGLRVSYRGIRLRPSGRWSAVIGKKGKRVSLGTYDTLEEAAEAYDKKKIEFEAQTSGSQGGKNCGVEEEIPARGASTEVVDSQGLHVRYRGIRLRSSGRWAAVISIPGKKGKRVCLGTYDTPEEAAEAYNKKRRQFDAMICHPSAKTVTLASETEGVTAEAVEKRKLKDSAEADTDGLTAYKRVGVIPEASTTGVVINSETNKDNDDETRSSSLEDGDEFGFSVIDCYGQFVGEYSRMDDELLIM